MDMIVVGCKVSALQQNKILHLSKLEAFADDKLNVAVKIGFVPYRLENIVFKGENSGF